MTKEKKEYTAFYLERTIRKRIRVIVENPNSMFDNDSVLIRFCVKKTLPDLEKELQETENESKR
jgi:hypothetical protein